MAVGRSDGEVDAMDDEIRVRGGVSLRNALLVTEESVYGTILVSGMIVVSRGYSSTSWETFLSVIGTVLVFWVAHIYAGAVAGYHVVRGDATTVFVALKHSFRDSLGFLFAALPPSAVLLLGALQAVPDDAAVWVALWLGVVILGVIGYRMFALRQSSLRVRILGSLSTAAFGVAMIVLKALIH
jgi:hypothetical protein